MTKLFPIGQIRAKESNRKKKKNYKNKSSSPKFSQLFKFEINKNRHVVCIMDLGLNHVATASG